MLARACRHLPRIGGEQGDDDLFLRADVCPSGRSDDKRLSILLLAPSAQAWLLVADRAILHDGDFDGAFTSCATQELACEHLHGLFQAERL